MNLNEVCQEIEWLVKGGTSVSVAVSGADNTGKSTALTVIANRFKERNPEIIRFPSPNIKSAIIESLPHIKTWSPGKLYINMRELCRLLEDEMRALRAKRRPTSYLVLYDRCLLDTFVYQIIYPSIIRREATSYLLGLSREIIPAAYGPDLNIIMMNKPFVKGGDDIDTNTELQQIVDYSFMAILNRFMPVPWYKSRQRYIGLDLSKE